MRLSIKSKIIGLGVGLSFILMTIAFSVSVFIFQSRSKADLIKNVDYALAEITDEFKTDTYSYSIFSLKNKIKETYDQIANNIPTSFETKDDEYLYYCQNYGFIYSLPGMIGFSQEKSILRNYYFELESLMSDALVTSGVKHVFLCFQDTERDRFIFIVDTSFGFDSYKEDCHFLGSIYNIQDADYNDLIKDGDFNNYFINGQKHRYSVITNPEDETDPGVFLFVQYSEEKINESIRSFIIIEAITFFFSFATLIVIYILLSDKLFVNNIKGLTEATKNFTDKIINNQKIELINPEIKAHDEIKILSDSFITLENAIINYLDKIEESAKEKEKINAELHIASRIQLESLPRENMNEKDVMINASITSAKEVGGDFYDYFHIDDNKIAIIISDVSGKGIPASLFMMRGKELIKSKLLADKSLEEVCFEVNNELLVNNEAGLFITSFIGVIDLAKKEMNYVSAGHENPFIINDKVEQMKCHSNFILGGINDFKYKSETIKFQDEDRLFLFTDGLNESINRDNEEFGYQRIKASLEKNMHEDNQTIINNMAKELVEFASGLEQFDDVTMLLVKFKSQELKLHYEKPNFDIITDVTNRFNDYYSFVDKNTIAKMDIIIDELLNNYVSYETHEKHIVEFEAQIDKNELIITFRSNGEEYNPLSREKKFIKEFSQDMPIGGLGVSIVRDLADKYAYKRKDGFNVLIIKKTL